jgi:hypothetical protein
MTKSHKTSRLRVILGSILVVVALAFVANASVSAIAKWAAPTPPPKADDLSTDKQGPKGQM